MFINIYKQCISMFIMKKKIKKYGNSLVIVFDKEDIELYGIKEGDWIELEDMLIQSKKEVKRR